MNVFSLLTLGPAGSFSDQAARYFAKVLGIDASRIDYKSPNEEVVRQTLENLDRYIGIVSFETTGRGLVPEVIGELISGLERNPRIYAEYIMPIAQCLLHMGDISKVRTIVTHPQSVAQCRNYLRQLRQEHPHIEVKTVGSNSEAVKMASEDGTLAAIGPKLAGELYGLHHIVEGIQDSNNNETRFIAIHSKDHAPTGVDRTTLIYKVENKPAALDYAIGVFGRRGLNKTGQHSIPTGMRLGEYLQLTEVEAHRLDPPMQRALRELEDWTIPNSIYILGSYPRYVNNSK